MSGEEVFRFESAERELRFHPVDPTVATRSRLSPTQIEEFNRDGFLSPLPCLDQREAAELRSYMDDLIDEVVRADDRRNAYSINNYHRVCRPLHDLVLNPAVVDYATDILGSQAVCWSTHAFCKLPNDGMEVPLHQDANYWPFTPTKSVTLWLAIDDVDDDNAAMHFVAGSHRRGPLPHEELALDGSVVLNRRAEGHERYTDRFVNTLKAGEVSLHTDLLLHGSRANTSDRRRCGITLRFVAADVRVVDGAEAWTRAAVHIADGDPSAFWPNTPAPTIDEPHRMARFVGGFDGNR
ncbi:MAG: phytanoyl-CoA dioxygenase family protein [Acidimicrobiales bacterium]